MKKVFNFFVVLVAVTILCGCSDINSPNPFNDLKTKGRLVFSNQSEDPYAVVINSSDGVDQFSITGNTNETKTYPVGHYIIHLKQTDGYVLYPSEFDASLELTEAGATLCWTNKEVWWKK